MAKITSDGTKQIIVYIDAQQALILQRSGGWENSKSELHTAARQMRKTLKARSDVKWIFSLCILIDEVRVIRLVRINMWW